MDTLTYDQIALFSGLFSFALWLVAVVSAAEGEQEQAEVFGLLAAVFQVIALFRLGTHAW